jgi:hypothetical protein
MLQVSSFYGYRIIIGCKIIIQAIGLQVALALFPTYFAVLLCLALGRLGRRLPGRLPGRQPGILEVSVAQYQRRFQGLWIPLLQNQSDWDARANDFDLD